MERLSGTFAVRRLNALLKAQAFGALGALVPRLTDMIVSGNVIGVDALAGIAATVPVTIGALFLGKLVYCGSGYLYAKCQGEFDREGAREIAGMALELAAVVGALIYATMFFGRDMYMDLMGISGSIREQAVAYWRWTSVYLAVFPSLMVMWRLVYADGETVTTAIGDVCQPVFALVLTVVLAKATGSAGGSALGTLIAEIAADSIMMLHLFRKANTIAPKWCFSLARAKELVFYSLTDASTRLCQCGFMAVVNRLVVYAASAEFLPVVGVIALLLELREVLDKIGDAYTPIAEMYLGEGNLRQLRILARHALSVAAAVGAGLMAALAFFAPEVVAFYGIPRGLVFDHSVTALRICCVALPVSSVIAFMTSHYLVLGRVAMSVTLTVAAEFLMTAGCASVFCFFWGLDALWIGLPFGGFLALVVTMAYAWMVDRRDFPMLIPPAGDGVLTVSFVPETGRIVRVRDEVERFLSERDVPAATIGRIMLLVEECAMALLDNNGKKARKIVAEGSFHVEPESVRVVIRDTGRICDITDDDARVSGLRSFVIAGMMRQYSDRRYLNTIGCNRAAFTFSRA